MKKSILMIMIVFLCFSCFAIEIGAAGDFGFIQDVLISKVSVQADFDLRVEIDRGFEMRIPVSADFSSSNMMIESGVDIIYYPWEKGFFAGLSAFRFGWLRNKVSDSSFYSLNQIEFGWTLSLPAGFFFEPSVCIRDPSKVQTEDYSALLGEFNNYRTFRLKAKFGWKTKI